MKLKIIEYFWAVGKKTKRVKTYKFKLSENIVNFQLNRLPVSAIIKEDVVNIEISNCDGKLIRSIKLKKGEQSYYRPMSMDAGYEYIFKLTNF